MLNSTTFSHEKLVLFKPAVHKLILLLDEEEDVDNPK